MMAQSPENSQLLIVPLLNCPLDDTVQSLCGVGSKPEPYRNGMTKHVWKVDNKYFTADVDVICAKEGSCEENFTDLQAILFVYPDTKPEILDNLSNWVPLLEKHEIEIQLLLNTSTQPCENEPLHDQIWEWVLNHNVELINSYKDDDEEEDEGFAEKVGMERVKEALNSHMWPHHVMKETQPTNGHVTQNGVNSDNGDVWDGVHDAEFAERDMNGGASFEQLFANFQLMKDKAQSLPDEQRKDYAEKVALAFWSAMGGSDDEDDT